MTILTLNRKELEAKIGNVDEKMEEKITMFGTPVEESNSKEIAIEIFPNRPDLLSLQGFARSFLQYLGKKGVAKFNAKKPEKDYKVKVDSAVKKVRPFTACSIVKGLKLNDEKIKELIEIQEKLHLSIGRKRKKVAIGIYPLEKIKLPIRYTARKPEDIVFRPLESNKEMNGKQILRQLPTGRDYADLLKDAQVFPVFIDADNKVLSLPPIINSHETGKISEKTKEVFIECSGQNLEYLKKTLNILVTTLEDMGGKIYSMNIADDKAFISPDLSFEKMEFKIEDLNKTLGLDLNEKQVKQYLEKMGLGLEKGKTGLAALIPPYRTDILHWIDLTEEVAIAHGYDNFKPEIPEIATTGEEDLRSIVRRRIAEILSGLGLLEASSYHLTTKKDIKKIHFEFKDFIEVEDSKTEYGVLRMDLLTNLLKIFSENSDSTYPQKIFEVGKTFSKNQEKDTLVDEKDKLSIALVDEKVNFTELKQVLDYLFKMLDKDYQIKEVESSNFISGRAASILVDGKEVGIIGEVAPRVLKNWKLKMPVSALELDLNFLFLE
jgi:phenylalanyl-tRNA synthetase beta chain